MGVTVDSHGAVELPQMTIPFSSFASGAARDEFLKNQIFVHEYLRSRPETMSIADRRKMMAEHWQPALARAKLLYPVESVSATIGGVYTDVITPKSGVQPGNTRRVLINLHGGAFTDSARIMGALESMPVASLGGMKVVTVDYRQGPEYKFPAASEDVAAVYRELLKTYTPGNIGIYGCSAGGFLTAEVVAWLGREHLPAPGAIGIFCASAGGWIGGDSGFLALPLMGFSVPSHAPLSHPTVGDVAYFSDADFNDPLVAPIVSAAVLAKFPPTLIISSTRDSALSPAVYTHTRLVQLGVDAQLNVWEGLSHGFFTNYPELPESREAWNVVVSFFDKHLGK